MNHAILGGGLAGALRVLQRLLPRRPVVGVQELLPAFVAAVIGPGREPVHRLEVARPAVFPLAARPDAPFESDGTRRLLGELEHLLARAQLLLDALALGDVAPDALVALEAPLAVKHRRAADAQRTDGSVRDHAAHFEVAEGLAGGKRGLVLGPRTGERRETGQLPARLVERRLLRAWRQAAGLVPPVGA